MKIRIDLARGGRQVIASRIVEDVEALLQPPRIKSGRHD